MKKNLTLRYCLHQLTYFGATAGTVSFATAYLLEKEFHASAVGAILACSGLLSCAMQPVLASFADRSRKCVLPRMIIGLTIISMLCLGIQSVLELPQWLIGTLFLCSTCTFDMIIPLLNSVNVYYNDLGFYINYGAGRAVGSLAYSFSALILGHVINRCGIDWMIWIVVITQLALVITTLGYPNIQPNTQQQRESAGCCTLIYFFFHYRWYCVSLIGIALLAAFHIMTENYMIAIMERLGGNSRHVGTGLFIASVSAVPVLFLFNQIRKRISDLWLLKIAGLSFILKAVLIIIAASISWIYCAGLLQTVTYAFLSPALVYYAHQKIDPADMVKGQSFATSFYALGCAFGNLVGGILIEYISVIALLWAGLAIAIVGTFVLFVTVDKQ